MHQQCEGHEFRHAIHENLELYTDYSYNDLQGNESRHMHVCVCVQLGVCSTKKQFKWLKTINNKIVTTKEDNIA